MLKHRHKAREVYLFTQRLHSLRVEISFLEFLTDWLDEWTTQTIVPLGVFVCVRLKGWFKVKVRLGLSKC